jgi:methionine-rich copper-binding protein CopC
MIMFNGFVSTARAAAFAALLGSGAPAAHAHAMLDHANPRVGSVVAAAPQEVRLWFTQALEPRFSSAELRSPAGAIVASGGVDRANARTLVIRVRSLAPGKYKVIWKIVSVDSHRTEGDFSFEVAP